LQAVAFQKEVADVAVRGLMLAKANTNANSNVLISARWNSVLTSLTASRKQKSLFSARVAYWRETNPQLATLILKA